MASFMITLQSLSKVSDDVDELLVKELIKLGKKTVFADLQPLQNLRRFNLDSVQLTPSLVPVKPSSFRNLEVLDLSRIRLCDQDRSNPINFPNREEVLDDMLQDFSVDLDNLVELYPDRTLITDADIVYLDGQRELTQIKQTRVKNASLSRIYKSTFANRKFKYIDVGYTLVTDKGIRELRDKYLFHLYIPSLQPVALMELPKNYNEDCVYEAPPL
ncbi:hypothetical protein C2G38_2155266 [Gigaspora rosea]|uniref:Uncharacterized protein n=1 Tax=Gigaspora rosea TaxID=44941 RepID=A0A397W5E8_9GLOM|nr:hypothetical protein C2G38_2155266 [Gigaspora rosea]